MNSAIVQGVKEVNGVLTELMRKTESTAIEEQGVETEKSSSIVRSSVNYLTLTMKRLALFLSPKPAPERESESAASLIRMRENCPLVLKEFTACPYTHGPGVKSCTCLPSAQFLYRMTSWKLEP